MTIIMCQCTYFLRCGLELPEGEFCGKDMYDVGFNPTAATPCLSRHIWLNKPWNGREIIKDNIMTC